MKKSAAKPTSYGASRGHFSPPRLKTSGGKKSAAAYPTAKTAVKKPLSPNRRHGFANGSRPYDYAAYERAPATPQYLAALVAEQNFPVNSRELSAYWRYYCLLREHNAALDLTRIMGIEATVLKHFIDSAIAAEMVEFGATVVDLGSGAGFPGVPLALRLPEKKFILAESRGKRVKFLEILKRELPLTNLEIFPRSVTADTPIPADDFITRAVEIIPATLARLAKFIRAGGRAIFLKGPNCGQEITDAQQQFKGIFKMTRDEKYQLGAREPRRLVIFTRRTDADKNVARDFSASVSLPKPAAPHLLSEPTR